jgi:hypothetical protein
VRRRRRPSSPVRSGGALLLRGALGTTVLHECSTCLGVWIDKTTLEAVCRDQERQAAVLAGAPATGASGAGGTIEKVRYVKCPTSANS